MIKSKKEKKKTSSSVIIQKKPHSPEIKPSKQKDFEKCAGCPGNSHTIINLTRFEFECGHWFHQECYITIMMSFNGSLCPICHSDERFDFFNQDLYRMSKPGESLKLDADHAFAMTSSNIFYDIEKSSQIWGNIEQMSDQRLMLNIDSSEIELYSRFDPNDRESMLKKANHTILLNKNQSKFTKMRKMFVNREHIKKIIDMKYTINDMKMGGITMEFLVQNGYDIKSIHSLGFVSFRDLIDLKFNSHVMTLKNDDDERFVNVQFLVDYYDISYKNLIMMFSHYHLEVLKEDEASTQKGVMDFCNLHFSKNELVKLRLININVLFGLFGKTCFNADCLVELCKGKDVNIVHILQQTFKFDGNTIESIHGFNSSHLDKLGWEEGHFFGDIVREQLSKKYNMPSISSNKNIIISESDDSSSDDDNGVYEEENSEDEEENEEESEEYEEESEEETNIKSHIIAPPPGINFTDKRGSSRMSSSIPPKPVSIRLDSDIQTPPPVQYSAASSSYIPNTPPQRSEVAKKRQLE